MVKSDTSKMDMASRLDEEGWCQLAKMAEMGLSVAAIVHEVRQPLSALKMALQLMKEGDGEEAETSQCLDDALQQATRLERLLTQMRNFLKPNVAERREIDLGRLVDDVLVLITGDLKSKNVDVVFDKEPDVPSIFIEAQKIEQVIFNLLVNARDAVIETGGGRISVIVSNGNNGGAEVIIADDGAGIDPSQKESIFEPFFTTKGETKGTGLGLYIARQITEQHGAVMELLDEPQRKMLERGKVSTAFRIAFPEPRQRLTIPPPVTMTKKANHVLVVIHDQKTRESFGAALEQEGVQCTAIESGEDAISNLGGMSYDLLVVEKDLPAITGLEVARLAHNFNPLLPILFVGSAPSMDLEKETANLGVVDYVEKSIDADQLSRRLKVLLKPGSVERPVSTNNVEYGSREDVTCPGISVLLVELEDVDVMGLTRTLRRLGCEVTNFDSREQAGAYISKNGGDVVVARADVIKSNRSWYVAGSGGESVHVPIAVMDSGGVDKAIEAIHLGAHGAIAPPFDEDKVAFEFKRAVTWILEERSQGK
ncbi:MAG: response regulator [Deltaproteobacteria bacterium]|nr:response regulator [Deltaproteobacteria bacterium]